MKYFLLPALLVGMAFTGALQAQTYKATYATKLYLSGGGSPVTPLTLQAPSLGSPYTLTFPADDGASNQFLQTDGSGNLVWASLGSGLFPLSASVSDAGILLDITNTGAGAVAQFEINNGSSTANALTAITNGTGLAIQANGGVQVSDGNLTLANTSAAGQLRLHEPATTGSDYTAFVAQDQSGNNITYTLPGTNGTAGQALVVASSPAPTATSATLQWSTAGGLSTVTHNATLSGNGTSGSPLAVNLGNANTWTANQTFAGAFTIVSNGRIALTNSDNNGRDIRWQEPSGSGTQYVGIRAPGVAQSSNYVWPNAIGSAGQVLTIQSSNSAGFNDSATLTWTTPGGSSSSTVDSTLVGDGSGGSPLGLDLAQSNVWTATITTFLGFLEVRNEPLVITNTDNAANEIRIQEASGNGTNYFAIRADTSIGTNDVWIMPSTAGTAGQVLGITAVNTPSNRFYTLDWKTPTSSAAYGYTTYSANATLTTTEAIVGVNTSSGAVTLTLPAANSVPAGKFYIINNESSPTGNTLTINRAGTDLIDGGTSTSILGTLIGSSGATIYSNGVNAWYRVP